MGDSWLLEADGEGWEEGRASAREAEAGGGRRGWAGASRWTSANNRGRQMQPQRAATTQSTETHTSTHRKTKHEAAVHPTTSRETAPHKLPASHSAQCPDIRRASRNRHWFEYVNVCVWPFLAPGDIFHLDTEIIPAATVIFYYTFSIKQKHIN